MGSASTVVPAAPLPVSHVMDACRALLNGTPAGDTVTTTLVWCAALFVGFCPLAVRAYGRQQ